MIEFSFIIYFLKNKHSCNVREISSSTVPPVQGDYAFKCSSWKDMNFKTIELKVSKRYDGDNDFAEILNRFRKGHILQADIDIINTKCYIERISICGNVIYF